MVTIQYEITTTRRGQMTTTIKERSFPSETALERWAEKMAGNVTILRYELPKPVPAPGSIYATQGEQLCSCGVRFSLCNGPSDHAANLAAAAKAVR